MCSREANLEAGFCKCGVYRGILSLSKQETLRKVVRMVNSNLVNCETSTERRIGSLPVCTYSVCGNAFHIDLSSFQGMQVASSPFNEVLLRYLNPISSYFCNL